MVDGWQPIETARADEAVLVTGWHGDRIVVAYRWTGSDENVWIEGYPGDIDEEEDNYDALVLGNGGPTLWQPLPEPPEPTNG